jgi:hypothetical protein
MKMAIAELKKKSNINIRVSEDLKDKIEYIKMLPGGLTGFIEGKIREVVIDQSLVDRLNELAHFKR